jgi:hypothetical protein
MTSDEALDEITARWPFADSWFVSSTYRVGFRFRGGGRPTRTYEARGDSFESAMASLDELLDRWAAE